MNRSLAGRSALITGSTQGIGLAIARRLAASGCNVVVNGLDEPKAMEVLRQSIEREHEVTAFFSPADLRDPDQIAQMMSESSRTLGTIDILVNNAVVRHTASVEQFTRAAWDESLAVNLSAAFHAIRLALPGMKQRRWGRIVNVSSIYGLRGATNRVGYVTTKTALIGLTRAVALETVGDGITCNVICPGTTETPVHEVAVQRLVIGKGIPRRSAELDVLAGKQPTGRFIAPASIAALVEFLCGSDGADVTGVALPIDGGWSINS
jgi:3-hydroxybutyrate dehydrogenase